MLKAKDIGNGRVGPFIICDICCEVIDNPATAFAAYRGSDVNEKEHGATIMHIHKAYSGKNCLELADEKYGHLATVEIDNSFHMLLQNAGIQFTEEALRRFEAYEAIN